MNPATVLASVAALVLTFAPQGSAAALTQSEAAAAGLTQLPAAATVVAGAVAPAAGGPGVGNVSVVVPGTAIAPADGLDHVLQRGALYRAEFVVWVAANVGKATLSLQANGVVLSSCTSDHVRPGATAAVMCLARVAAVHTGDVSIGVVVQTSNFGTFSRTFAHPLTG